MASKRPGSSSAPATTCTSAAATWKTAGRPWRSCKPKASPKWSPSKSTWPTAPRYKPPGRAVGQKTNVLDVLINNAGINGGMVQTALGTATSVHRQVFDTNYFGAIDVTQAFIDLLRQSPAPRIVNVSSSQGSITLNSDPTSKYYAFKGAVYQSSKAALNMYTSILAHELRDAPFKVNAVDPGFTATDFNHHHGTGTVEEARSAGSEIRPD